MGWHFQRDLIESLKLPLEAVLSTTTRGNELHYIWGVWRLKKTTNHTVGRTGVTWPCKIFTFYFSYTSGTRSSRQQIHSLSHGLEQQWWVDVCIEWKINIASCLYLFFIHTSCSCITIFALAYFTGRHNLLVLIDQHAAHERVRLEVLTAG